MPTAILLAGFNNWGKSRMVFKLFQCKRFSSGKLYSIQGINAQFNVESRSNDDLGDRRYLEIAIDKMSGFMPPDIEVEIPVNNFFGTICPSREHDNNVIQILSAHPFNRFQHIYIFLLKNKWDYHAILQLEQVRAFLSTIANVVLIEVDDDDGINDDNGREYARSRRIINELRALFP